MSSPRRKLVKICGVTRVADAVAAVELGADFVGLNFWPGSPRRVEVLRAAEIVGAIGGRTALVGVFVDATSETIVRTVERLALDIVQLHGDEPPALAHALRKPHWRAFRGIPSREALGLWPAAKAVVVDARVDGRQGGTGVDWNYRELAALPRDGRTLLVAGGIRPGNVAGALTESGADGVDVASGVESAPGIKDREKMRRLIEEVHRGST
jgi:phosphoribosylanthranilate isomerase